MRFDDPVFHDALFRQKRKHGKWRVVARPALETAVADTHAHLHMQPEPALALARCAANGVTFVCAITDPAEDGEAVFECLEEWCADAAALLPKVVASTAEALENEDVDQAVRAGYQVIGNAAAFGGRSVSPTAPHVRIAAGVHPHNARLYDEAMERHLRALLHDPRVAAVGEIGLDYHYDLSPRDEQRRAFREQLRLAKEAGLPVVLHVREAHDEALAIMREEGFPQAGTLLHCYNLDWETLKPWVEAGCYVAFGGPLTFKNADEVREAAMQVPLNRLLTETDAPYMTPEPLRGINCTPDHVIFTAAKLLEVLGAADSSFAGAGGDA
ncbi:MAG: TatD family hydrolase, partial [Eggerthellaceae bacterium]|nr:TatD family hydrolase [Eggerthellaceae bacterium]